MILHNIEALCASRGISIYKLEKELNISENCIKRWDEAKPRVDNIKKVADYFGVTIDELLKEA